MPVMDRSSMAPEKASHPELLRAVQMRFLLRRFGHVMGESRGSEGTFLLSRPVTAISIFLSHSWSTPAWFKTLALMYYANIQRALFAGCLVMVVFWTLELTGATDPLLVLNKYYVPGVDEVHHWPASHKYAPGCVVFFFVLIFGQEIPVLPQFSCFLDKCCIHQTDEEKKMAGIRLLGVFLNCSEKLVILWQPEYLTRLWCVYELAAFRHIKGPDGLIEFLPLKLPLLTVGLFLFHAAATVVYEFMTPLTLCAEWHAEWSLETLPVWVRPLYFWACFFWILFLGAYPLIAYPLWMFCRSHMDDRRTLLKQIRNFKVTEAHCCHESDRAFVEGQIELWFGSIEQFEHEVRTDVGNLVARQLDEKEPMPWHMISIGTLSHTFFSVSQCVDAYLEANWSVFPRLVAFSLGLSLCADAIGMSVALRIADRARSWGLTNRTTNILGTILTSALMASAASFSGLMMVPATPLPVSVTAAALLIVVTYLLYFTKCSRQVVSTRDSLQRMFSQEKEEMDSEPGQAHQPSMGGKTEGSEDAESDGDASIYSV